MRTVEQLGDRGLRLLLATLRNELILLHGPRLVSLVLYGSRAREDARPDSDIDVLLVAEEPWHHDGMAGARGAFEATEDCRAWTAERGRPIVSIVPYTPAEALESKYLYLDMTDDAVFVYDRGDFMRRKLETLAGRLRELGSYKVYFADGSHLWFLKPGFRPGDTLEF